MDNIAYKRFFEQELARTAVDECLDTLRKDDWAKLQSYQGRNDASAKTFFFIVYRHCLEDYYRKLFGRCEPPAWVKRLGAFWATLYKQLCCQSISEPELLVLYHQQFEDTYIKESINVIHNNDPKCLTRGKKPKIESLSNLNNANNEEHYVDAESPEDKDQAQIFEQTLYALQLWLQGESSNKLNIKHTLAQLNTLKLNDETIFLLRMVYQEGVKIPTAAKLAKIEAHTARRRINDALAKISACFNSIGIT